MPSVKVRRDSKSAQQKWDIIEQSEDVPNGVRVGVNGGYAGIWSATVDVPNPQTGHIQSHRARIKELHSEPTGLGIERTPVAIVEW